jgi:hypothetical protein
MAGKKQGTAVMVRMLQLYINSSLAYYQIGRKNKVGRKNKGM